MKKEKTKKLPFVQEFVSYFVKRGKRVLKLKDTDFDHPSIDVHPDTGTIWVWFHGVERIVARAQFTFDGLCYGKYDYRP